MKTGLQMSITTTKTQCYLKKEEGQIAGSRRRKGAFLSCKTQQKAGCSVGKHNCHSCPCTLRSENKWPVWTPHAFINQQAAWGGDWLTSSVNLSAQTISPVKQTNKQKFTEHLPALSLIRLHHLLGDAGTQVSNMSPSPLIQTSLTAKHHADYWRSTNDVSEAHLQPGCKHLRRNIPALIWMRIRGWYSLVCRKRMRTDHPPLMAIDTAVPCDSQQRCYTKSTTWSRFMRHRQRKKCMRSTRCTCRT